MEQQIKTPRVLQNIYFYISVATTVIWILTFVLTGAIVSGTISKESIPVLLIDLLRNLLYYQVVHFVLGVALIIYILVTRKKKLHETKIYKTVIGVILTPPNYILFFAALFVLAANVLN